MATITPDFSDPNGAAATIVTWASCATGDTLKTWEAKGLTTAVASVQISGTFGGTTATLEVSNDGSTWFTAKDTQGEEVSATVNGFFEVSVSARYVRPALTGGSGNSVNVILVMRG